MKHPLSNLLILLAFLFLLLMFTGCQDEIIDEVLRYSDYRAGLYAPIDQDEVTMVPGHGKDSYYPLVEGFTWYTRSDTGFLHIKADYIDGEAKINSISQEEDDYYWVIRFENITGYEAWNEEYYNPNTGHSHQWNSQDHLWLPLDAVHAMQEAFPRAGIDTLYEENKGETVSHPTRSNNYDGIIHVYYDEFLRNIYTPSGKYYKDCIHLTVELQFPNGYSQDNYQKKVEAYLAKGIGYVYLKTTYTTGKVAHYFIEDYSRFGETVTFEMNTTDTVSKTIAPKVYIEGEHVALPNVEREGYVLSSWQAIVDDQVIGSYEPGSSFSMGDKDVTMKAIWIAE